jgi:hypothetical protein
MARAQSQYLRIYDVAGVTYERWQNYYISKVVQFSGQNWEYEPFTADGLTIGAQSDEEDIVLTVPAKAKIVRAFEAALNNGRLVDLSIYQFDPRLGNEEPRPVGAFQGQQLIGQFSGQVISASGSLTTLDIKLGSAFSPVGAQIPPRKFTTAIMGKGARI